MVKVDKAVWEIFITKTSILTDKLYNDSQFSIEMFFDQLKIFMDDQVFKKVSKQDLLQEYLVQEGIIPIKETLTFKEQNKSLKQFLSQSQPVKNINWQISLRLVRLRINCQKELKYQIKLIRIQVIKLISILRVLLEQKIIAVKSILANSFFFAMKENCTSFFFDQCRKIFRAIELDLEYIIEEGKRQIIEQLMGSLNRESKVQISKKSIKEEYVQKDPILLRNRFSKPERSLEQKQKDDVKKQNYQTSVKKKTKFQSNFKYEHQQSKIISQSKQKQIKKQSSSISTEIHRVSIQKIIQSYTNQQSKKSTTRYIKVKPRTSKDRNSLSRTMYEQKNQSKTQFVSRQSRTFDFNFISAPVFKQKKLNQSQRKKSKSKPQHKLSKQEEAQLKKLFVIHY